MVIGNKLKVEALKWLEENEPKWGLDEPINREEFLNGLAERISPRDSISLQQGPPEQSRDSDVGAKE